MDDIDIRLAIESDCEAILDMLTQLAVETGDGERFRCQDEDLREHGFGVTSLFRCLIATKGEQNLGLALYFPIFSTTRGRPGVYLQDLWVSSDCRDSGLGYVPLGQRLVRARQSGRTLRWPHDAHFNEAGNRRVAELFLKQFRSRCPL